jgi:hypothetical protein
MRALGLVGVIVVLAVGYFVVQQSGSSGTDQASPQEQIDVVSIRQQLRTIAQAERQYLATHGEYATIEQLAQEDLLPGGAEVRGYAFSAVAAGTRGFTITATPIDPEKADWPVLEIDERMEVVERQSAFPVVRSVRLQADRERPTEARLKPATTADNRAWNKKGL